MEPHPVPQDILNTEFKLFGSFTLKQFMTMLVSCLVGVFVFLLQIPILIKLPVATVIVLGGISAAIIPNFATWLSGYIKAIFVSPRYVWVKENKSPDLLKGKQTQQMKDDKKVAEAKSQRKINLDEISLEKLLATRDNPRKTNYAENSNDPLERTPRSQNLDRVFNSVFTKPVSNPILQNNQQAQAQTQQQTPQQAKKLSTKDDYIKEINALKAQLGSIVKDQNHKEKEAEILHRLNDLYQDLKMMNVDMGDDNQPQNNQNVTNFQGETQTVGQIVSGIVVTKKDKPVEKAKVIFTSEDKNVSMEVETLANGKFVSNRKLPEGRYSVQVLHPSHRFNTYQINVGPNRLPAYKLREK